MSIYIVHRRRKTSNALDTLVLSEQKSLQEYEYKCSSMNVCILS